MEDVAVGPGAEQFMHTTSGGVESPTTPPLVLMPGYGAGTGFFFRCVCLLRVLQQEQLAF